MCIALINLWNSFLFHIVFSGKTTVEQANPRNVGATKTWFFLFYFTFIVSVKGYLQIALIHAV